MAYTPLDSQIIHSSVWREADHIRLVWITMLAMANRDGYVKCSIIGLADAAKVPLEKAEHAIERLKSPDRYSSDRTDGRRIEETDGGWMILNFLIYRQRAQEAVAKDKAAARQKRWYDKHRRVGPALPSRREPPAPF